MKPGFDITGYPVDSLVHLLAQTLERWRQLASIPGKDLSPAQGFPDLPDQSPDAVEEPEAAGHALVGPFQVPFRRRGKQTEKPGRIGAVSFDHFIRVHHVALGFGHLGAVQKDHALGQQAGKRLVHPGMPQIPEHLGEKAGVEKVQDRMLDAADILVHRHPVVHPLPIENAVLDNPGRCSAENTRTIPRRCPWCRSPAGPDPGRRGRWC